MRQLLLTLHLGFQGLLQLPLAGRLLLGTTCTGVGPWYSFRKCELAAVSCSLLRSAVTRFNRHGQVWLGACRMHAVVQRTGESAETLTRRRRADEVT